jgi:ribosomal protein S18 acetylase RimI-like enzyme
MRTEDRARQTGDADGMGDIGFEVNGRPAAEEVCALALSVGWRDPSAHGLALLQRVWDRAPCTVLARDGDRLVGMCRAMWDGGILAEVRTVVVHPDYQRRGIGTELVRVLLEALDQLEVCHVTLVTGAGREPFYQRFGFDVRPVVSMIRSDQDKEDQRCCSR